MGSLTGAVASTANYKLRGFRVVTRESTSGCMLEHPFVNVFLDLRSEIIDNAESRETHPNLKVRVVKNLLVRTISREVVPT